MRYLLLLILLAHTTLLRAQLNPGARITAMGENHVAIQGPENIANNPAGIVGTEQIYISAGYQRAHFTGLSTQQLFLTIPLGRNYAGVGIRRYGNDLYKDLQITSAYAKAFKSFSVSTGFMYSNIAITGFESTTAWGLHTGAQYEFLKKWRAGLSASYLINTPKTTKASEPLSLSAGLTYQPTIAVLVTASMLHEERENSIGIGLEYLIAKTVALRSGLRTSPFRKFVGIGYLLGDMGANLSITQHPILGFTSQFEISYAF